MIIPLQVFSNLISTDVVDYILYAGNDHLVNESSIRDAASLVVGLFNEFVKSLEDVFSKEGFVFLRDGLSSILLILSVVSKVFFILVSNRLLLAIVSPVSVYKKFHVKSCLLANLVGVL